MLRQGSLSPYTCHAPIIASKNHPDLHRDAFALTEQQAPVSSFTPSLCRHRCSCLCRIYFRRARRVSHKLSKVLDSRCLGSVNPRIHASHRIVPPEPTHAASLLRTIACEIRGLDCSVLGNCFSFAAFRIVGDFIAAAWLFSDTALREITNRVTKAIVYISLYNHGRGAVTLSRHSL